jgi:integrase
MPEGKLVATPTGPTLRDLVGEWKRSLAVNRSTNTVKSYGFPIDDFLRYLKPFEVSEARALSRKHIEGWQEQLASRQLSPKSRSAYVGALRVFMRWAEQHYKPFADSNLWLDVASVPDTERNVDPLSDSDFAKIVAHLRALPPTLVNLRDRALFFTFVASGARVGDVLRLKRKDISTLGEPVQRKAHGGKTVAVPPSVQQLVSNYLDARHDNCPAMWVTHARGVKDTPLQDAGVLQIWIRLADRIGVPTFTNQQLRHTAILKMIDAEVPYIAIAEHIGNKRIEPFRKYSTYLAKRRQEALDAMENLLATPGTG